MTQNQIAYKNAAELERHNKMVEEETAKHNRMQEALQNYSNALQKYQIAVNNTHYVRSDIETARANRAREQQNLWSLTETQRTNAANEVIKSRANSINAASVAETSRHQKAMESIQSSLNESIISRNYAETGYTEAKTYTESFRPGQILNEIDLTNSQANLNREKMSTESTQQIRNISGAIRDAAGATGDIVGIFTGAGAFTAPKAVNPLIELVNSL